MMRRSPGRASSGTRSKKSHPQFSMLVTVTSPRQYRAYSRESGRPWRERRQGEGKEVGSEREREGARGSEREREGARGSERGADRRVGVGWGWARQDIGQRVEERAGQEGRKGRARIGRAARARVRGQILTTLPLLLLILLYLTGDTRRVNDGVGHVERWRDDALSEDEAG